ncbi:hypothetical protein D3C86_1065330 [compost metagenome]
MQTVSQTLFPETAARLEAWRASDDVVGVLLVGSKCRGYGDALSDDDLEVLLTDEAHARLSPEATSEVVFSGEGASRKLVYDAYYTAISDLEGKVASPRDLDHWPYEQAQVLFDRDGRVEAAVRAAGRMDLAFRRLRLLHAGIDAYNAVYRAQKCKRRDFEAAVATNVARGAKALSRLLFALEGRWVPMDHWLEPELASLSDSEACVPLLLQALKTHDPDPLLQALTRLQSALEAEGFPAPSERAALFLTLIHPSRADERLIHGLP